MTDMIEREIAIAAVTAALRGVGDQTPAETHILVRADVLLFLKGVGTMEGLNFGEVGPNTGPYWWRSYLPGCQYARRLVDPQNSTALRHGIASNALKKARDLISSAMESHIYDPDNGQHPEADCPYSAFLKEVGPILELLQLPE